MKQSVLKKILIVSGILFALFAGWTALSTALRIWDAGTSIIGGADGPTAVFLVRTTPTYSWAFLALLVFVGAGIALLVKKIKEK